MNSALSPQAGYSPALDAARGLAAVAVLANHLRSFVFVNWDAAGDPGPLWAAFYALTSFGHQAVIVFFVLSGFLVGRTVVRETAAGSFRFADYAVKRLVRLWIVLAPALLLTAMWDQIGMRFGDPGFYAGAWFDAIASGPTQAQAESAYALNTLLANAAFLQTIVAPPFGSNGPLWSLAYEFWYYALFPALWVAAHPRTGLPTRLACGVAAAVMLASLPPVILLYGLIWLLGVAAASLQERIKAGPGTRLAIALGSLAAACACAVAPRFLQGPQFTMDLALGVSFALWVAAAGNSTTATRGLVQRLTSGLANMSYTLYLTHFPLLACVTVIAFQGVRFDPGPAGALVYAIAFLSALMYAWVLYWVSERHTGTVQKRLLQALKTRQPGPA